ncbi:MAG TPA: hypothetical protein VGL59_14955 [Polyangia bacterium]
MSKVALGLAVLLGALVTGGAIGNGVASLDRLVDMKLGIFYGAPPRLWHPRSNAATKPQTVHSIYWDERLMVFRDVDSGVMLHFETEAGRLSVVDPDGQIVERFTFAREGAPL